MKNITIFKYYMIILVFAVFMTVEAFASQFIVHPSSTQTQMKSTAIPLTLNNSLAADIMSIELEIGYDPQVLTATGVSLTGTILENQDYLYVFNTSISGTIFAVLASSTDIYSSTGLLLNLDFLVTGSAGETSDITIVSARFNNDAATSSDGIFTVASNTAPTFANILPQTVNEDNLHSFTITVTDLESNPCDLTLTISSADTTLVPDENIDYTCLSNTHVLSITPTANMNGDVTITIMATDPSGLTNANSFALSITPVNDAPSITMTTASTTNLLVNPDAETGDTTGWTISQNGGSGWSARNSHGHDGSAYVFITSYGWCRKYQLIDLLAEGYSESELDSQPDVYIEEWARARQSDDSYQMKVELRDENQNVIDSYDTGVVTVDGTYTLYSHTFQSYGSGLRYIYFEHGGKDSEYWGGQYGAVMDDALVMLGISQTNDSTIDEDNSLSKNITISDIEGDSLTLSLSSSNTNLVSDSNITFSGTGESRTLTITPTTNASGYATITVAVFDGNLTSTTSFELTVNEINDPPIIGEIDDMTKFDSSPIEALELTATDFETSTCDLGMNISSSNTTLIPTSNISYTCASSSFYFTLTPVTGQTGTSTITIDVTDSGGLNATSSFTLNINLPPELSSIPDTGTAVGEISFTFVEADGDTVSLTVTSSDQSLISDANISINGIASNSIQLATTAEIVQSVSLNFTQESNVHGLAIITVTASATGGLVTETFNVIVSPPGSGNALSFDGSSNYLDIPYDANLNPSVFTISLWVKAEGGENTYRSPVTMRSASSRGFMIYASPSNQWQFTLGNGSTWISIIEAPVVLNQWTHLALTYDGSDMAAYVNGVLQGITTTSYLPQTSFPVRIGAGQSESTADFFWDGEVDEVRIYNIAQSQEEIRSVMCQRLEGSESGLVAYYRFDHYSGTMLDDLSGYGYHGTLYYMDDSNWIVSGAALGDTSIFDSIGTVASDFSVSLSHSDGDTLTAYGESGSYSSLHVYLVNEAPSSYTAPAGFSTLYTDHYFGVFPVGTTPSYNVSYNYSGNTGIPTDTGLRLAGRSDNSSEWIDLSASLNVSSTNLSQTSISAFNGFSITEFIPGMNQAPTIGVISGQTIDEDSIVSSLPITVVDAETASCSLSIGFHSSDSVLIPIDSISYTCNANTWYLTITPVANLTGMSDITITLTDAGGLTDSETFTLTVSDVNDTPLISTISDHTTIEDTAIGTIGLTVSDIEDTPCSMDISITSSDTSIIPNENISYVCDSNAYTLTITPAPDQNGVVTISLEVTDSGTLTAIRTFDLTITAVNDDPILANPITDRIATEGTYYSFTFDENTFTDVDYGETLTYEALQSNGSALPAWLSFDYATRTFSGTPGNSDVGSITITITATDGSAQSITDTFQLTVNNTNTAPVLDNPIADQTSLQDDVFSFTFPADTFSDDDAGDSISYTSIQADGSTLPLWLTFDADNRTFTGTPSNYDVGMYTITVIAEDTLGLTAEDSFYLTITDVNDAPEISDIYKDVSTISLTGLAIDEDSSVNDITFAINDIDDTNLTVSLISTNTTLVPNSSMDYSCTNGSCTMSLTPVADGNGSAIITVIVTDPQGLTASNSFDLTVTSINDLPVVTTISGQTIDEDTIATGIQLTVTDIENASCSFDITATSSDTALIASENITYICSGGVYQFTISPTADQNGTAAITITATDNSGGAASVSFDLIVTAINDAPTMSTINDQSVNEGESIDITFTTSDIDGDSLNITTQSADQSLVQDSAIGLTNDGDSYTLTITPTYAQAGSTEISVSVSDGTEITHMTFAITVNEVYYMIAGQVFSTTETAGNELQGVTMTLTGTHSYIMITDTDGYYTFTTVRPGDYTLTASKADEINLSIADAIYILKAAARKITLTYEELIAADAYNDGRVGAYDASKVAQYISGLGTCINAECIFWQFVPEIVTSSETFPLVEYETNRRYTDLSGDVSDQNFIGIGCGNVSE